MDDITTFEIPFYENFRIDRSSNIYIINNDGVIINKIPYNSSKFEFNGKIINIIELVGLAFYGIADYWKFTDYKVIDNKDIEINGIIFRKIPNFIDGYYISRFGSVYSMHCHRLRKCEIDDDGYHRISFPYANMTHMALHRLVYKTWVGEIPEGMVIDHYDNKKWNNDYTNLQAITAKNNSRKAADEGLYMKSFYWNTDNVRKVCEMMVANISVKDIAATFGITPDNKKIYKNFRNQLYSFRKSNRSWTDITSKYDFSNYDGFMRPDSVYRDSEIIEMRKLYASGKSVAEIANLFNTKPTPYFSKLVRGLKRNKIKI